MNTYQVRYSNGQDTIETTITRVSNHTMLCEHVEMRCTAIDALLKHLVEEMKFSPEYIAFSQADYETITAEVKEEYKQRTSVQSDLPNVIFTGYENQTTGVLMHVRIKRDLSQGTIQLVSTLN